MCAVKLCDCQDDCPIPYGLCHCECGATTNLAKQTSKTRGLIQGHPVRYLKGHAWSERTDQHTLTEINEIDRSAQCNRCGLVTIKKDGERWRCTTKHSASHAIVNADSETKRGWCRGCQTEVDLYAYRRGWACKSARDANSQAWRDANREKVRADHKQWRDNNREHLREYGRAKNYGMDPGEYARMMTEQNGQCLTCDSDGKTGRGGILHSDHNHKTGRMRGLLCSDCNRAIGLMKDDPEIVQRILIYLSS